MREQKMMYKNYKGEIRERIIIPYNLTFSTTRHHPKMQWLLEAFDCEKNETRVFALADCDFAMRGE